MAVLIDAISLRDQTKPNHDPSRATQNRSPGAFATGKTDAHLPAASSARRQLIRREQRAKEALVRRPKLRELLLRQRRHPPVCRTLIRE
jgi:hypothetical protein